MVKLKIGYKWKSIEGTSKGKFFSITKLDTNLVTYKFVETGRIYTAERKYFERYIERVNKYWAETNKAYKNKKEKLKNER